MTSLASPLPREPLSYLSMYVPESGREKLIKMESSHHMGNRTRYAPLRVVLTGAFFSSTSLAQADAFGGIPATTVAASYWIADELRFIAVDIHFNPELAGFSPATENWADSPWHKIRATAERVAYMKKISEWAVSYRPSLKANF